MRPTLLLTRPRAQSERFAKQVKDRFQDEMDLVISPVLDIVPGADGFVLPEHSAIVFTSENAVTAIASAENAGQKAFCVGGRTARAAQNAGFTAVSAGGDVEALIRLIADTGPEEPLVYARGAEIRVDLVPRLSALGFSATEQIVYRQAARPLSRTARDALQGTAPVLIPLFSPRSAHYVSAEASTAAAPLLIAALSSNVADAWTGPSICVDTARVPDVTHMLDALARLLRHSLP